MSATDPVQAVAEAIWAALRRPDQGGFTHAGGYIDPDAGVIDVCVSDMTKVAEAAVAAAEPHFTAQLEAELRHMRQDRDRLKDVLHHRSQALNRVANQNDELRTALNRAQEDASERK